MSAREFADELPSVLDQVDPDGIIITREGQPIARVLPFQRDPMRAAEKVRGHIKILGDVESTGSVWNAQS